MARRRWTAEQRARALELYVSDGTTAAARATGIPGSTIQAWARRSGLHTMRLTKTRAATDAVVADRAQKRAVLVSALLERAIDMLGRMTEPHTEVRGNEAREFTTPTAPALACQRYAVAAGILIDKFRLELGEATSRHGYESAPDSLDAEIEGLLAGMGRLGESPLAVAAADEGPA